MITHRCGTVIPADIETYVRHLAACPEAHPETGGACQGIVSIIEREAAQDARSRKAVDRTCERCGETFTALNVRKRFCTTACRSRGYRERSAGAA